MLLIFQLKLEEKDLLFFGLSSLCLAGSRLYIWFVFHVSLPNEIKLLLFNIFFFDLDTALPF